MQQIVDLQTDVSFKASGIALLSIALDSLPQQERAAQEYGVSVPMLADANAQVSKSYDVMKWAAATGEPGHTFVLVDESGVIRWIRDYGAAENGGSMYVPPAELNQQMAEALQ